MGNNDNPNVCQLACAVRGVLCFKLNVCKNGNADPQELLLDKVMRPSTADKSKENIETVDDVEGTDGNEQDFPSYDTLSLFVENVCVHIAGFVGKKLSKSLECSECKISLRTNDMDSSRLREDFLLLMEKDKGGLFKPSDCLIGVCKIAERVIRAEQTAGVFSLNGKKVEMLIKRECMGRSIFENLHDHHSSSAFRKANFAIHSTHKWILISEIAKIYIKTRFHYIAKSSSLSAKPVTNRSKLTKLVHFTGN